MYVHIETNTTTCRNITIQCTMNSEQFWFKNKIKRGKKKRPKTNLQKKKKIKKITIFINKFIAFYISKH